MTTQPNAAPPCPNCGSDDTHYCFVDAVDSGSVYTDTEFYCCHDCGLPYGLDLGDYEPVVERRVAVAR